MPGSITLQLIFNKHYSYMSTSVEASYCDILNTFEEIRCYNLIWPILADFSLDSILMNNFVMLILYIYSLLKTLIGLNIKSSRLSFLLIMYFLV